MGDEIIRDLKEKIGIKNGDSLSYRPIASSMEKTLRGGNSLTNETQRFGLLDTMQFNETEHGFHKHLDADTSTLHIIDDTERGQRCKSQSVWEEDEGLQSQIYEYQKKEKEWNEMKKAME